jgi:hypothetical protein
MTPADEVFGTHTVELSEFSLVLGRQREPIAVGHLEESLRVNGRFQVDVQLDLGKGRMLHADS